MTDALRIHYCLDKPRDDRRGRARCGHWVHSNQYTDEPERVTCKACRKLLALPPHSSKPTAMTKLSSILPLALLLLAACDTDGSTTGSDSAGSSSAGSSSDALSETSGDASTSGESTGGSTGEDSTGGTSGSGGEGMGTGEPEMCLGQGCALAPCRDGLSCLPHPETGEPVCVSLCGAVGDACGASCIVGTELECLIIVGGPPACFPVV